MVVEEKTNFLQFACRLSNEDVDILASQNGLTNPQKNMVRSMMAYFALHIKVHVYYTGRRVNQVLAVMTLGKICDEWCEAFLEEEEIWKGYMADQIAMRGLMSGYEIFRNILQKQYETEVSRLHFWNEEKEGISVSEIISQLEQTEVFVSKNNQMQPLKTVLFTVDILADGEGKLPRANVERGLCNGCLNTCCPNRVTD